MATDGLSAWEISKTAAKVSSALVRHSPMVSPSVSISGSNGEGTV